MILEMTHIASKSDVVNQRTDTENISVFYLPLLKNQLKPLKMHIFKGFENTLLLSIF